MDHTNTAIAGIALIPLIITVIQFLKRFDPPKDPMGQIRKQLPGQLWLGLSAVLGVIGQVVVFLIDQGTPYTLNQWSALVIMGLAFGLATSKAYDETLGRSR